jgi:hypothetical protein
VQHSIPLKISAVSTIAFLACGCGSDAASGGNPGGTGAAAATGGSGGSGNAGGSGGSGAGSGGGTGEVFEPPLGELGPGWNILKPGRETICSRGTAYRYFVRRGTVNRVVIEFDGGGACGNAESCAPGSGVFNETAIAEPWVLDEAYGQGIHDHTDPENPFADWHHVFIPYCTGDFHSGNADTTYELNGQSFVIHHKGAVNARAVLDWIYRNLPEPEKVLVTGYSAGGTGAGIWAPHIRNHYTSSKIYLFGDSGVYITPGSFADAVFEVWKPESSFPTFLPNYDPADRKNQSKAYVEMGNAYPDMFLSTVNFAYDNVIVDFFASVEGVDAAEWSRRNRSFHLEIDAKLPNYSYLIAPGSEHCTILYPSFYSIEVKGVRLLDWVKNAVNDVKVETVDCDPDCGTP